MKAAPPACLKMLGWSGQLRVGQTDFARPVSALYDSHMSDFTVEIEREEDGRWLSEVTALPGVLAYGSSRDEAVAKAKALAFRVLADRLEHGEDIPEIHGVFAVHE
jgi:predicted RNase H-like HicB family nuclease